MGKIKQGILGAFSGKVAGVVGTSWKGIAVMKSLPPSVANPKTAGQVAQRGKFANTVAFAQLILASVIKPLWDRFAQQKSGYNAFVSENISLFADTWPSPAADLVISQGKMESTAIDLVVVNDGVSDANAQWTDDSGEGFKQADDEVYLVAVNETQGEVAVSAASAVRSDESATASLPSNAATGDVINFYLAFRRSDGTVVSNTSFKTETVS